jgi:hypothetical protein
LEVVYPFERFSECAKAVITLAREKAEMIVFWPDHFRSFRLCLTAMAVSAT